MLLSQVSGPNHQIVVTTGLPTPMVYRGPDPGPIHNRVLNGIGLKIPRFYAWYHGQKIAELNGASVQAGLSPDGSQLLLSGQMAGIIPHTTAPGTSDFFVFAINRGGAKAPGPFPGRPNVTFDAVVGVEITPNGILGAVVDLNTGKMTPIPRGNITLVQFTLHVIVPTSTLPSTGAASPTGYTVDLYTSNGSPTLGFQHIASFTPEFRGVPVRQLSVFPATNFQVH
jgi:hypothetical protein